MFRKIDVGFESVCVLSDAPGSAKRLIAIREILTSNGIEIAPPSAVTA